MDIDSSIAALLSMGFPLEAIQETLSRETDLNRAIDILRSSPGPSDRDVSAAAEDRVTGHGSPLNESGLRTLATQAVNAALASTSTGSEVCWPAHIFPYLGSQICCQLTYFLT